MSGSLGDEGNVGGAGAERPLRVGVVGAGLVAQAVHLAHLADLPDRFAVAGIADPDVAAAERAARRHGIPHVAADHRALLEEDRLDALIVCSPNGTHARVVLDALDAGVHVLVEKPMCIAVGDADRIVAARDRTGLVVQVGYMKRFDDAYAALLDDLPGAGDGLRHVLTATVDPGLARWFAPPGTAAPRPPAEPDPETAEQVADALGVEGKPHARAFSDAFLGALVHDVNLVHGLLERMGRPSGGTVASAFGAGDGAVCGGTVRLADGVSWSMVWALLPGLADFREHICLLADDGVRTLDFPAPYLRQAPAVYAFSAGVGGVNERRTVRSWRERYVRQLEHFHACLTTGVPCRTPPEQARADIALLAALYRAALTGGRLEALA